MAADPSGPYINTDEGHQNSDARSIVLYGTPFHDTYNPSVLMPFFTVVKAGFLALFGVNLFGIRLPSVLASALAIFLDRLLGGGELDLEFPGGNRRIIPVERGKRVIKDDDDPTTSGTGQ